MLLESVSDIATDDFTRMAEQFGYIYGLMDMRQIWFVVEPFMANNGQRLAFAVGPDNAFEVSRVLLAVSIINYACYIYDAFSIPIDTPGLAVVLKRQYSAFEHKLTADKCFSSFLQLNSKYDQRNLTPM